MTNQGADTKQKIMEVARVLFANNGFEGTSIRDIAKSAEVNIASVNYHFSNKENLFNEILNLGYVECSNEIRRFYGSNQNLEDVLVHVFYHFLNKSHDLITYFKMMMSSQHSHKMTANGTEDEMLGPPGGKVIVEAILKEVGSNVSDEDLHWALKCLFSHVVHTSLMYNCCFKNNDIPFSTDADLVKNIKRLCRVVVGDLKKT